MERFASQNRFLQNALYLTIHWCCLQSIKFRDITSWYKNIRNINQATDIAQKFIFILFHVLEISEKSFQAIIINKVWEERKYRNGCTVARRVDPSKLSCNASCVFYNFLPRTKGKMASKCTVREFTSHRVVFYTRHLFVSISHKGDKIEGSGCKRITTGVKSKARHWYWEVFLPSTSRCLLLVSSFTSPLLQMLSLHIESPRITGSLPRGFQVAWNYVVRLNSSEHRQVRR
jgi:hypothetical protein